MKIYLFDDTPQDYREKHVVVSDYHDVLTLVGSITLAELDGMRETLKDADCILIHRSLRDADNMNRNDVYQEVLDIADMGDRIPLVIFSGEDNEEAVFDGDTFIERFNKTDLYENLPYFITSSQTSHSIDLRSLAHGEKIESKLASNEGIALMKKVRRLDPDKPFDSSIVEGADLHSFVQRSSPALGCSYSDIISEIKSNRITSAEFIKRISKIIESFNSYGKNIYRWGS